MLIILILLEDIVAANYYLDITSSFYVQFQFLKLQNKQFSVLGGSPGLVVMGGGSRSEGHGFDPSVVNWMDMTFFHTDLL